MKRAFPTIVLILCAAFSQAQIFVTVPVVSNFPLPTPPFGPTNLVVWIDTTQTNYIYTDNVSTTTVTAIEDLSGNGRGFVQGDKNLQPPLGGSGEIFFNAQNQNLACLGLDLADGGNVITFFAKFKLDSASYGALATRRYIVDISEALATATPPGGGTGADRASLSISGTTGGTGRKSAGLVSVADGTSVIVQQATGSVLGTTTQFANDTWVWGMWVVDLRSSPASMAIYMNGDFSTPDGTLTWIPVEGMPWAFNAPDSAAILLGNKSNTALFGGIKSFGILSESPTLARRQSVASYLSGL